jgi:serine/threonine-protein kinase
VPCGWFWCGGDSLAYGSLPRERLWAEGFVIQADPVTNRVFRSFLNDLVDQGREPEALRWVPRDRSQASARDGQAIYGRDPLGRFILIPDPDGDLWDESWPVFQVSWSSAVAFARHRSLLQGRPWRVPQELEWEKAARGVDGRFYPWGDHFEANWCCVRDSQLGRFLPARIQDHPLDISPYGVKGLAGNIRDWCRELNAVAGPDRKGNRVHIQPPPSVLHQPSRAEMHIARGGYWMCTSGQARSALRFAVRPDSRSTGIGFRIVRSWPFRRE